MPDIKFNPPWEGPPITGTPLLRYCITSLGEETLESIRKYGTTGTFEEAILSWAKRMGPITKEMVKEEFGWRGLDIFSSLHRAGNFIAEPID
mgnify:CR=1 FL=1